MDRGPSADWVSMLPTELLEAVSAVLSAADLSAALAVSAAWKEAFGLAVQELRPTGRLQKPVNLSQRFPELQRLFLDAAPIGDVQAQEISKLRLLTHLSMQGCKACTDAGLDHFSSLTGWNTASSWRPSLPVFSRIIH